MDFGKNRMMSLDLGSFFELPKNSDFVYAEHVYGTP
jgi:hypothetical protein